MSFHVGQKVICIYDKPLGADNECRLRKGAIYTIERCMLWPFWANVSPAIGVWLVEVDRAPGRLGLVHPYCVHRFRPVKTTSIEVFRDMLVNPPKEVIDA